MINCTRKPRKKTRTEKAVGGSVALKITQGYTLKFEKHQR